jgi:hypothetical protein
MGSPAHPQKDMIMSRTSDNTLAELEDVVREAGFDYPIAWALGFLIDNQRALSINLNDYQRKELRRLCKEIRQGS